jgi:hypothetical protein
MPQNVFTGHGNHFYGSRSVLKAELAKPENAFVKSLSFLHKSYSDAGVVGLTGKVAAKDADRFLNLVASLLKTVAGVFRVLASLLCAHPPSTPVRGVPGGH